MKVQSRELLNANLLVTKKTKSKHILHEIFFKP